MLKFSSNLVIRIMYHLDYLNFLVACSKISLSTIDTINDVDRLPSPLAHR